MKIRKLFGILLLFLCTINFISCNNKGDDPVLNTKSVKIYDVNHGMTNLAGMDVYLNDNNEFFGSQDMRISPLGDYKSLQEIDISYFYDDLRCKAEVGKYYAAASFEYMALNFDTYPIPMNEKYLTFTPVKAIEENGAIVGYEVIYEVCAANTYNLPAWWSTVAVIDRSKETEAVLTLPSVDCEVFTIGQIDGIPQIELSKVADKLKISLEDYPDHNNLNGKISLFLRIKESYSWVYVEIK